MSDLTRAEVIEELTEQAEAYQKLIDNGSFNKEAYSKSVECLKYAIDSLKTDEAYNLMYEKVDFIEIPEGATNGDMIKAMFPKIEEQWLKQDEKDVIKHADGIDIFMIFKIFDSEKPWNSFKCVFDEDWWNSPYRKEQPKQIAFDVGGHTYGVIGGDEIMKEFERKGQGC